MTTPARPCPPELKDFCFEFLEAGKPKNFLFESQEIPSNEAIAIVRRLNSWRLKQLSFFSDRTKSSAIRAEEANQFFLDLIGLTYSELDALRFRVDPANNIPSRTRKVTIYMPAPLSFSLVGVHPNVK
jgi:hypothetical protein